MPILKNARHEKFAQLVTSGDLSATRAYINAGYSKNGADGAAVKLQGIARVKARIKELKEEAAQDCKLTKKNILDFLADVMLTPAGSVHKAHHLCQSFKDTSDINEVRMPDKLSAAVQISKMCGWNEPDKIAISGSVDVVVEIGGSSHGEAQD